MSLPKGYLPREGDVLVIHVTTRYDVRDDGEPGDPIYVHVSPVGDSSYHKFRLPLADVIALHRRSWEIGTKVRSFGEEAGEIVAVCDDMVWVKSNGYMLTLGANEVEPDEAAVPPERPDPVTEAVASGRAPTIDEVAAVVEPAPKPHSEEEDDEPF